MHFSGQNFVIFNQAHPPNVTGHPTSIRSFNQVMKWGMQLVASYQQLLDQSPYKHQAIYQVLAEVYRFSLSARKQGVM